MTADRNERIKWLTKIAIAVLRQRGDGGYFDHEGGRVRAVDFRHNELSLTFSRRLDDVDRPATLVVKYDGEKVLVASWTVDGFTRRSYSPGQWENVLRRCDRMPAPEGKS